MHVCLNSYECNSCNYILREFACELTSSWPPARVEGESDLPLNDTTSADETDSGDSADSADSAETVSGAAVQTPPNHAQESQDYVSSQKTPSNQCNLPLKANLRRQGQTGK